MVKFHRHFFFLTFFFFLFSVALFTAWTIVLSLNLGGLVSIAIFCLSFLTPVLFVFSEILYRHFDNLFTRTVYLLSSYIGGMFLYWFIASIFLSVIFVFCMYFKITFSFMIPFWLYLLATLFFFIGLLQSFRVKITRYEVNFPDKYASLAGKKFALIADTHFGPVNQEIFARRIFKKIINQKPDAILFPGDMFDSECYKDNDSLIKEIKILTSKIPVFFTPGNHEQYGPFNHFMQIAYGGGMTVLVDESIRFLGVPVFGINFKQNKNMDEIKKLINENISIENPAIVLSHEPVLHDLFSKAGAFLVVSGHTHNGQFWPGNLLTKFFYGKFTYGLRKVGNLTSITTSGIGTFGPPIRTFNTPEIVVIEFK